MFSVIFQYSLIFRHPSTAIGRLLNPDRVIAIMLGVKDEAIKMEHRTSKTFYIIINKTEQL
jgi:hypothetical protein